MNKPTIGRIVEYRSRTGNYTIPAMIVATTATLAPEGVALYEDSYHQKGVPPLDSDDHVHLVCFTPGLAAPSDKPHDDPPVAGEDRPLAPNLGGSYQEWNVPMTLLEEDPEHAPGTWRWPKRT